MMITDAYKWERVELKLRNLLQDINYTVDIEDIRLIDELKQSIIVFAMKEKFGEACEVFLDNCRNDFYNSAKILESRHSQLNLDEIRTFMEEFYF